MQIDIHHKEAHKYTVLVNGKRAVNIISASEENRSIAYALFHDSPVSVEYVAYGLDVKLVHDDRWEIEGLNEKPAFVYGCECEECSKYVYQYLGLL